MLQTTAALIGRESGWKGRAPLENCPQRGHDVNHHNNLFHQNNKCKGKRIQSWMFLKLNLVAIHVKTNHQSLSTARALRTATSQTRRFYPPEKNILFSMLRHEVIDLKNVPDGERTSSNRRCMRFALSIKRCFKSARQSSFNLNACCLLIFSGFPIWARNGAR